MSITYYYSAHLYTPTYIPGAQYSVILSSMIKFITPQVPFVIAREHYITGINKVFHSFTYLDLGGGFINTEAKIP